MFTHPTRVLSAYDPVRFSTIGSSMWNFFIIMTLEGSDFTGLRPF